VVALHGFKSGTSELKLNNRKEIQLGVGTNSEQDLVYEMVIPLKELMPENLIQVDELFTLSVNVNATVRPPQGGGEHSGRYGEGGGRSEGGMSGGRGQMGGGRSGGGHAGGGGTHAYGGSGEHSSMGEKASFKQKFELVRN
jgi:hypothetical protein